MSDAFALHEAARLWARLQDLHLSYPDLRGRASRYLSSAELPPIFNNLTKFPTHRVGRRWTKADLLDIFAQTFQRLPPSVPCHGWDCFLPHHLTDKCMVASPAKASC